MSFDFKVATSRSGMRLFVPIAMLSVDIYTKGVSPPTKRRCRGGEKQRKKYQTAKHNSRQ
jgi:hypothetical protein